MGWRVDLRAALWTLVQAFHVAHSTTLRQVHKARPPDFAALPCLYIGGINSPRITHDAGTRVFDGTLVDLVLIDEISDSIEVADRLDALTDLLVDYLTANPHAVSGLTLVEPVRQTSTEVEVGGVPYAASVVTISAFMQEGRS